ncbi:MAG: DUF1295 domain-containing protein [Pseudomonadales bacterium]|nr:DUF1295 domain-containing protein [Pseudomonadales bacterium]
MLLLLLYLTATGVAVLLWLVSLQRNAVSFVDILWPVLHLIPATQILIIASAGEAVPWSTLLTYLLLFAWATRLMTHLAARAAGEPEDGRYVDIRNNNEPGFRYKSVYIIFGLQSFLACTIALLFIPIASGESWSDLVFSLGYATSVAGFFYETLADEQLTAFRKSSSKQGLLETGLWSSCRHPNYFGEWLVWVGFTTISIAHGGWWSIFILAGITFLLIQFSGVARMEKTIPDRRPRYSTYIQKIPAFFPRRNSLFIVGFIIVATIVGQNIRAQPAEDTWLWHADMNGRNIGQHSFDITREADIVSVESNAQFDIRFFLLGAYTYQHQSVEHYDKNGCLLQMRSETQTGSEKNTVVGKQLADQSFLVSTNDASLRSHECLMTFAYWNPKILQQSKLINAQTGKIVPVDIQFVGTEKYNHIEAERYELSAPDLQITLWYTLGDRRWIGLASTMGNGKILTYQII